MMLIVRTGGERPDDPGVRIVLERRTPSVVADGRALTDLFCIADEDAVERLRGQGWQVVMLHDGWYQDDGEGGVAIWGQGAYWEVRDTPFTVREAVGPAAEAAASEDGGEMLDVRRGIFGA
jgi:hypothetical protein